MTCGIYCIENTFNQKKYVGMSVDIEHRWAVHRSNLYYKKHENEHLQNAWEKYGEDIFKFWLIEECNEKELIKKEIFYIFYFDTIKNGYNIQTGGEGCPGYIPSEEVKRKISIANRKENMSEETRLRKSESHKGKKNHLYGKHHSEETKEKISKANSGEKHFLFGKHLPEETKNKIGNANRGRQHSEKTKRKLSNTRKGNNNPFFGKTQSPEVRQRISEAKKKYWERWRLENGR